ncbi:hypothetical protein K2173_021043 [Erythroxylum novogranatense]|uniref:Ubiquitin-like domain-containing protein n=1 Tax=Erythroxylum novogranatense TaxID=1862640 RepID=A0AAV8TMU6_9ROSI|nr:hypothetical protein K2173_021043 [Erythroxylum novogranatense]
MLCQEMPVPALKEQIASVTGVLSEQQRLICRGKVLKDDQLLSAYYVEDGHTLHPVVRQPVPPSHEGLPSHPGASPGHSGQVGSNVVIETFSVPDQGEGVPPEIDRRKKGWVGCGGAAEKCIDDDRGGVESVSERLAPSSGSLQLSWPKLPRSGTSKCPAILRRGLLPPWTSGPWTRRALDQEVRDLHEQIKALKDELSEEAMSALQAQLATGEEEKIKAIAAKGELVKVCKVLEEKLESERKLKEKFLQDCHAASIFGYLHLLEGIIIQQVGRAARRGPRPLDRSVHTSLRLGSSLNNNGQPNSIKNIFTCLHWTLSPANGPRRSLIGLGLEIGIGIRLLFEERIGRPTSRYDWIGPSTTDLTISPLHLKSEGREGSRSMVEGVEEISTRERKDGLVVEAPPRNESTMTPSELRWSVIRNNISTAWGPRLALRNERIHNNLSGYFAFSESFFSVGGTRLLYAPIVNDYAAPAAPPKSKKQTHFNLYVARLYPSVVELRCLLPDGFRTSGSPLPVFTEKHELGSAGYVVSLFVIVPHPLVVQHHFYWN